MTLRIALFKSITMFCGTDIIPHNTPKYFSRSVWMREISEILCDILLAQHINVMDMNNVMSNIVGIK